MELRVVTDVEREMRDGIAPDRGGVEPKTREELLLPLTVRERLAVASIASALKVVGEMEQSDKALALWKTLCAAFKQVTGVQWQKAPW